MFRSFLKFDVEEALSLVFNLISKILTCTSIRTHRAVPKPTCTCTCTMKTVFLESDRSRYCARCQYMIGMDYIPFRLFRSSIHLGFKIAQFYSFIRENLSDSRTGLCGHFRKKVEKLDVTQYGVIRVITSPLL